MPAKRGRFLAEGKTMATLNSLAREFGVWTLDLANYLHLGVYDPAAELSEVQEEQVRALWANGSDEIRARIARARQDFATAVEAVGTVHVDDSTIVSIVDKGVDKILLSVELQVAERIKAAIELTGRMIVENIEAAAEDPNLTVGERDRMTFAASIAGLTWQKLIQDAQ